MDAATMKQQVLKFNRARNTLLVAIAFTVVNLVLSAFNAGVYMLFSASAPQFIFEMGRGFSTRLQSNMFQMIGLAIAVIVIILYFICWLFAKRLRAFIFAALILFIIDSLLFVFLALFGGFDGSYIMDAVFHIWILFYLISGTMAWIKLRGYNIDDFNAALQNDENNV